MSHSSPTMLTLPVGKHDHIQGSSSAVVTLLEYGDYQCPFAGAAHPIIKTLHQLFGDQLRFVFRHFPLTSKHADAQLAAEAAEAAGSQGKFWDMHDYLFEHQGALDAEHLVQAAGTLGLDTVRFRREVTERMYADRVRQDIQSGRDNGVRGTPTIFINGVHNEKNDDVVTLKAKVQAAFRAIETTKGTRRS